MVGATGATGKRLVEQILDRGLNVTAIVRSRDRLPPLLRDHERLTVIEASLLKLEDTELARHLTGCEAVASCLGHTLSFKGIFGSPRRLVTDATRRLCNVMRSQRSGPKAKFVLMNTTGNRNRDLDEPISIAQKVVLFLLRRLVPPHADNEQAAEYLRTNIGQVDSDVEWVAVRPDSLFDSDGVTEYELHPSPIRSAIFNAGSTSRVNVGHFMAELITDDELWDLWKGKMPVIYNVEGKT